MEKNKNMPFVRIALALALFICSAAIAFILKSRYDMGPSPFDLSVQQWFFSLRGRRAQRYSVGSYSLR